MLNSSQYGASRLNSDGAVVVFADVLLFCSYITAALDYAYGVFKHAMATEEFNGMTIILRAHWS